AQAQAWRDKLAQAKERALAQQKARKIQAEIRDTSFAEYIGKGANSSGCGHDDIFCILSSAGPRMTAGTVIDITSFPFKLTRINQLKKEAALLANSWGSPDSMIARVAATRTPASAGLAPTDR
ncbi:MAG TPA: hypothetical protein VFM34_09980, partial [Moraxellaceae bacterium]|nr:hypothetical protein [Moraxellaceae bacterium]